VGSLNPEQAGPLDSRPRLWWCPTGPFAFLPLHAAGFHGHKTCNSSEWASDYVISSYTPSLSALLQAHDNPPYDILREDGTAALLVAEPEPVDEEWDRIPNTLTEVTGVKELLPFATLLGPSENGATVQGLIDRMHSASVVHLACHGVQNEEDPLQSGFVLHDGMLTLSQIMELDVPNAAVAFLSACESAMGDGDLPDESVHLAAAMLFLGFRSVVGTMW
jgi:CHAT domain-containing protein